jgi:hypothetical protein
MDFSMHPISLSSQLIEVGYDRFSLISIPLFLFSDRLCGLVVRVSDYRSRGPGFDSRPYQPLSVLRTIEELLE